LGGAMLCVASVLIFQIDKLANRASIITDYLQRCLSSALLANVKSVYGRYYCTIFLISVVELPYPAFEDYEKKKENIK
jgi:hypothetical protein